MTAVGIEALNLYGGLAYLDVQELCQYRKLDMPRFQNLLMKQKTVALPFEDPVSFAVNAAKPLIDALSDEERRRIEMLVIGTESGIDFGKSMSTYVHDYLKLVPNCRLFEVKQACYSGAVALQMAANFVLSQTSPGAKALVIASDISRFALDDPTAVQEWAYSEPSSGSGAAALLVGDQPHVLALDQGAYGNHAFEVMDTCRPGPDTEAGDADLSLMAYLDCFEHAFRDYARRVAEVDFCTSFRHLCLHTPFGGMVKGAHRHLHRKLYKTPPAEIESDFVTRLEPSLAFGQRLGNSAGASLFVALAGTLASADFQGPERIGLFAYGSGCCSEFFSGVADEASRERVLGMEISHHLDSRYRLSMEEYEGLLRGNGAIRMGTRDLVTDRNAIPGVWQNRAGQGQGSWLVLDSIEGYHRKYRWV
jgi:polyketide biosynthesis 3-hydroxy-3-methylglutaryl-CoA synthase-like enzyme PksG